ncbi:MAG TPA: hypothetical protein VMZ52_14855, partial [Bryobacteraceae bacterium]|nr:hypothetical protein [Bryobacteraceae bacterium]
MKKTSLLLVLAAAPLLPAVQKQPFTGRWDLTIQTPAETYPSWMEFSESEGKPQVRVVSQVS